MRIVVTLYDKTEIEQLIQLGADAFLVNADELSTKARKTFSRPEIAEIVQKVHAAGKLVYLNLNAMIHENLLPILDDFLAFLSGIQVDGIVCFDLSVLVLAEKNGLAHLIIYRPGTMNTNSYDPWFFRKLKIKGLTLSKDITLEELISIGEDYQGMEISLVGHGYLFLFYSKRPLLKDYFEYKHAKVDFMDDESFRLAEKARHGEFYPIFEDKFGTHIFRSKKLQSFNEIKVMRPYLSDLFLERMFLTDQEYFDAIVAYRDERLEAAFLTRYGHGYDSGFYYVKAAPKKGVDVR